jgi:ABC-2 type transport system ATP-binding protein
MIEFKNVTKNFGKVKALKNISLQIKKGQIVGLLGPNGAGKTTAMRVLLGILKPSKGKVLIGNELVHKNLVKIKSKIGYLPEDNPLYKNYKIYEYLQFIAKAKDIKNIKEEIRKVAEATNIKSEISRKIDHLSKGYRQRVGLAAALLGNPEILVLDEPTVGLDPNQIAEIRKLIKELAQEKTVIFSSHILSEVKQTCEDLIIIHKGEIVKFGSLKKLTKEKSLEKIFQSLTQS